MGQQTMDSKFCDYGLSNPESVLANPDKLLFLPPPTKKTVSRELQDVEIAVVSQSAQQSGNQSGSSGGSVEDSRAKITNDRLVNVSEDQSPVSKTNNGWRVYFRRKPDLVSARSNISNNQCDDDINCPQRRNITHLDKAALDKAYSDQPGICTVEAPRISQASSVCLSSKRASVSQCLEKSNNILSPANLNHPQLSPVCCSTKLDHHWQERSISLQTVLRMLNQSDQHDNTKRLMTLPSAELSRLASELEKRSVQLSLEEAKELNRVKALGVLEKYSKHNNTAKSMCDTITSAPGAGLRS